MDSKTPEPVLITMSVLAGLQTFFAGSAATTVMVEADRLLTAIFAFGALAVGAAQFGLQFYVRGRVVPIESVSERVVDGVVIAGPANDIVPAGDPVRQVGDMPPGEKELIATLEEMKETSRIYPETRAEQDGPL